MPAGGEQPAEPRRIRPSDGPPGFLDLYRRTKDPVFWFLRSLSNDRSLASDLQQDTFARLLEPKHWLEVRDRDPEQQMRWLLRVAHNLFLDWYRRRTRFSWEPLPEDLAALPCSAHIDRHMDDETRLMSLLRNLPLQQRAVGFLWLMGNLDTAEISEVLGIPAAAVSRHKYRIKQKAQPLFAVPGKEGQR